MPPSSSRRYWQSNLKAMAFSGFLYAREEDFQRALALMCESRGAVVKLTDPTPWHCPYYADELGNTGIIRRYAFFEQLIDQDALMQMKLDSCAMEQKLLSPEGSRTVNIDPGYLCMPKVVLASTKDYSHRIYLGQGIYAELTLYYMDNAYRPMPFTYNDYKGEDALAMFSQMREVFIGLNPKNTASK